MINILNKLMKTLKSFLYLLVVFAIVLSACKKNVHKINDDQIDVQVRSMEDLVVPPDFDWRMSMNSTSTLKATTANYFPASGYSTLAFEDLWPAKGDYDFNDLVVEYRFRTDTVGDKISEIIGTFVFRALGAGTKNGFGFELTGLDKTGFTASGSLVTGGGYISLTDGWEDGHGTTPVVVVVDDLTKVLPLWSNTSNWGIRANPVVVEIKPTPTPGTYDLGDFEIDIDNFNPFMIIDFVNEGRGREVHKVDYPPTDLADQDFFGTVDDNTAVVLGTNRSYRTIDNYPWVIDIPSSVTSPTVETSAFKWAQEKKDINWAYLHFDEWVESGGTLYDGDQDTTHDAWWVGLSSLYRNNLQIYNPQ